MQERTDNMRVLLNTDNMGTETQAVFWDSTDIDDCSSVEEVRKFWSDPKNFSGFAAGLSQRITEKCGSADKAKQLKWLKIRNSEEKTKISEKTLGNWLKEKVDPQSSENARENMFKLCFILKYDYEQTADFFRRVYLARPFNYRNLEECVYAFCMNNSLGYSKAIDIIEKISVPAAKASDKATAALMKEITSITDEQSLITYLSANCDEFTNCSMTARNIIAEFSRKCYELIQSAKEREKSCFAGDRRSDSSQGQMDNMDHAQIILQEALGLRIRKLYENDKITIQDSPFFLASVKKAFPHWQTYSDILKGDYSSPEAMRKLIILLHFYCFWKTLCDDYALEYVSGSGFDDYQIEINNLLYRAGYSEMYFRNPYDGLFLYAASTDDPLYTFQNVFEVMFHNKNLIE